MNTSSPISEIKGIGEKTAAAFEKMNVLTVGDILCHFPRDYVRYPKVTDINELTSLDPGKNYAIHAIVRKSPTVHSTRSMQVTLLTIGDPGHAIQLIWFRMPYLKTTLKTGKHFIFYGKPVIKNKRYMLEQAKVFEPEAYQALEETLQPVYSLTSGITNNLVSRTVRRALDQADLFPEYLPLSIRRENGLCEYNYALKQVHFPDSMEALIEGRRRLVFDEFFLFLMGMQYQKQRTRKEDNPFHFKNQDRIGEWREKLPYQLTNAQIRTIGEIAKDMTGPYVMQRLIQGDVGSGKTIIALLLMAWVSENGHQSAIMAPTEVLAEQHARTFKETLEMLGLKIPVILLTGSMKAREKRNAYERIALFPNAIIVGTHALIQERTDFNSLALVITDEQHRFGVKQRMALSEKGESPHILVMSATPIPRTLAMILYGDMDVSVIDQVPARRLPIRNAVVNTSYRPKAYEFIRKEIESGHQAYVICPFVEESENLDGENVGDYAAKLAQELPENIRIGILHGKQKPALKEKIMMQFASGELDLLVSTTVVEVGVNVPNATVMMIENADRFGLAQLHQLRGRVGRGDAQSYCIMVNTSSSKEAAKRLEILNKSNDGFFIASEDLKLRGPGDFFGIRQSGEMLFELADIYQDAAVLQKASEAVKGILEKDPDLEMTENAVLRERMEAYGRERLDKMSL